MKTLYIECAMGAAGDMLTAALSELAGNPDELVSKLNSLGIPGLCVTREAVVKCGITGSHMKVTIGGEEERSEDLHDHEHADHHHEHTHSHSHEHTHHHHSGMGDICALIDSLPVSEYVKDNAREVYQLIADAESHAHGRPVSEIHFHEVGTLDAVADVVAACMLIEELAPERIVVSAVNTGSGHVWCAHGILPVPAPATAHILRGTPIYSNAVRGELCTPTGAALLKHFATEFGNMPVMCVDQIGYGMGSKDFEINGKPIVNCVRVYIGESYN